MQIKELFDGSKKVEILGEIVDLGDVVDGAGLVRRDATLKDSSGTIKLVLWNEQTAKVNVGDKVKITNGYVTSYKGTKQLSTGKYGELAVIGSVSPEPEVNEELSQDILNALDYHIKIISEIAKDLRKQKK